MSLPHWKLSIIVTRGNPWWYLEKRNKRAGREACIAVWGPSQPLIGKHRAPGPGTGLQRHLAGTGREGSWAPASGRTLTWWKLCAAASDFPQSNRWLPSFPNPRDLFYVFLKGSRVSVTPAHKSQSKTRVSGRTGQEGESPNIPGKGGPFTSPPPGAVQGPGAASLRPLPRLRSPGSAVTSPERASTSGCCSNERERALPGAAVAHSLVWVHS